MNLNDEEVSRLIQKRAISEYYLRRRGQAGGLRPGEVAILRCLLHNAQEGRPELKPSQISAILGLQQPSITPSLHSLEARGYVQRRGGEQDRPGGLFFRYGKDHRSLCGGAPPFGGADL